MLALMNGWMSAFRLGVDAQQVIALRMMRLAAGGPGASGEAQRMVTEKFTALGEAQFAMMMALAKGATFGAATARGGTPIRRRVRANMRRLRS